MRTGRDWAASLMVWAGLDGTARDWTGLEGLDWTGIIAFLCVSFSVHAVVVILNDTFTTCYMLLSFF